MLNVINLFCIICTFFPNQYNITNGYILIDKSKTIETICELLSINIRINNHNHLKCFSYKTIILKNNGPILKILITLRIAFLLVRIYKNIYIDTTNIIRTNHNNNNNFLTTSILLRFNIIHHLPSIIKYEKI